jgi:hypothetical protein
MPPKKKYRRGRHSMTVCVAAICEQSKAIVCVADKAITLNQSIQWDADASKILPIGKLNRKPPCLALFSGEEDFSLDLVAELEKDSDFGKSLRGSMSIAETAYKTLLDKRVETEVLIPKLLKKSDYLGLLGGPSVTSEYVKSLAREINEYEINCSMLVCGFENGKGFIFQVAYPGRARDCTHTGYDAIGSGSEMAMARMLRLDAARSHGLMDCLYNTFDAKASAEIIGTVGGNWDASVMLPWRAQKKVPKNVMFTLEHIWDESIGSNPLDVKFAVKFRRNIKRWKKTIMDWGKGLGG